MRPHEIFLRMSPAMAEQIFSFLFEKEKPLYKATIEALVKPRKVRPIFIERKPRAERHAWMRDAMGKKSSDAVAGHILQICLVGQHSKVLCGFLDKLGIPHDENGTVDSLPPEPSREALEAAIGSLLQEHDREIVALYLQSFHALDDTGWKSLGEILDSDPRLRLGEPEGDRDVRTLPAFVFALGMLFAAGCLADEPKHLAEAELLLAKAAPDHTGYRKVHYSVVFEGTPEAYADCSGLMTALLKHSYGYTTDDFRKWFDSVHLTAAHYHDQIVRQRGFDRIPRVGDIQPGDILAIQYLIKKESTGHLMLAAGFPKKLAAPADPIVPGAEQWEVPIIDSALSGHGPEDTRYHQGAGGKDRDGIGKGMLRIYATPSGEVAGLTWTTLPSSRFLPPAEEELVIGRLHPGFRP